MTSFLGMILHGIAELEYWYQDQALMPETPLGHLQIFSSMAYCVDATFTEPESRVSTRDTMEQGPAWEANARPPVYDRAFLLDPVCWTEFSSLAGLQASGRSIAC